MKQSKRFLVAGAAFVLWVFVGVLNLDVFLLMMPWILSLEALYVVCETYRQTGIEERALDTVLQKLSEIEKGGRR